MGNEKPEVRWYSYVLLLVAVIMFSGLLAKAPESLPALKAFDFSTLNGVYGTISGAKGNFVGSGGTGARGGFLFA